MWVRGVRKSFLPWPEEQKDAWTEEMAQRVRALTVKKLEPEFKSLNIHIKVRQDSYTCSLNIGAGDRRVLGACLPTNWMTFELQVQCETLIQRKIMME